MRILVDADACPSINLITEIAISNNIDLYLYSDSTHNIINPYATVITLDKCSQSVDIVIVNDINEGDMLITQDFGLAALTLSKGALVVHPKGMIYTNNNIEQLIFERYLNNKRRKQKVRIKGPKKRSKDDDLNLINSIKSLL